MMDIVALLQCLRPHVTATTLRQFSRITRGDAGHDRAGDDGRHRALGRQRRQLSHHPALFRHGASRGPSCFGCSSVAMCTVRVTSTSSQAMKSSSPKPGSARMAWIGSSRACTASQCPGLAFFTLSLVSVQARRSFPMRVEQVVRSDAEKAASKAKRPPSSPKPRAPQRRPGRPKGSTKPSQSRPSRSPRSWSGSPPC